MAAPVPVLSAPEEWTAELVPAFDAAARARLSTGAARLVVDLSETTFLSSAALTCLIRQGKRLSDAGGALALARPKAAVVKVLRLVGLVRVLPAFDTVEEAIAHVLAVRSVGARP